MIQTLEPNLLGRDFVVGDLHGMYNTLQELLQKVNFDPTKDRLISVGDLVDRGPDSQKCLELLNEPWFHAVVANHEQMMLDSFDGGWLGQFWMQNGGFWAHSAQELWKDRQRTVTNELDRSRDPTAEEQRLFDVLAKVRKLPYVITINRPDGKKFHVIHAELPPGRTITDEMLADPAKVAELASAYSPDGEFITWGRYLFRNFALADLSNTKKIRRAVAYQFRLDEHLWRPGLSHIISGHTILHRPMTILGRTNIDTGAFLMSEGKKWTALTMLELGSWKFYQMSNAGFRVVEPLVVNMEDIRDVQQSTTPLIDALNQGQV